jgi:hypothetical protein
MTRRQARGALIGAIQILFLLRSALSSILIIGIIGSHDDSNSGSKHRASDITCNNHPTDITRMAQVIGHVKDPEIAVPGSSISSERFAATSA